MNVTILFTRGVFVSGTLIMPEYICVCVTDCSWCALSVKEALFLTDVFFVL